jgi:hypothetical protein
VIARPPLVALWHHYARCDAARYFARRLAADFGADDRLQVLRADELVQHGYGAVRKLIPDIYLSGNAYAVLGDGVDLFGRGL